MIYRFSKFEIDTQNYQLRNDGAPVELEPKVFDLLNYLILNRQKLVTRDELFENLWAGRSVSDTSLSNQIRAARKAIGDNGKDQMRIKTVHGRGYQFIAEIHKVEQDRYINKQGQTQISPKKRPSVRPSIAVLPFTNLSGDSKYDFICDGFTEDILTGLCQFRGLLVKTHGSVFLLKGKAVNPIETAAKLGADYLLEGIVRIAGDRIRITTQLVDGATGNHVWAEAYDQMLDDIFSVDDNVAQRIIATLATRLERTGLKRDLRVVNDDTTGFCVPHTVRISPDKGWGVFADTGISKGSILWRHTRGRYEVFDERSLKKFLAKLSYSEIVYELTHMFGVPEFPDHVIRVLDDAELINHSRKPTAVINSLDGEYKTQHNVSLEDVCDALLDDYFALIAIQDLEVGDELTLDYTTGTKDAVYFNSLCEQYDLSWPWL